MNNVIYADESYRMMGACFEVYREKGAGFLEAVYQECLEMELADQGIPFVVQPRLSLSYKGRTLSHGCSPDLVCFDKIVVELKAVSAIADEHRAQLHNYLRATGMKLGLLVNFGHSPKLQSERIAL
jgi:GxxExxY protein